MTANVFWRLFKDKMDPKALYKDGRSYFEVYKDLTAFTELMNYHVIPEILSAEDGEVQQEYFRIDVVCWKSRWKEMELDAKAKKIDINPHLWDLKVAVEHENSLTDWSDEVMKLIHIKCPLKVVIGYNHCDRRDEDEIEKLDFIARWMQEVKAFRYGEDEEYLLIIGNGINKTTGKSDYIDFGYRAYLYDREMKRFQRISA